MKGTRQIFIGGAVMLLAFNLLLMGCGGGSTGSKVSVYLTDGPTAEFDHVFITVDSVEIHTDKGWVTIPSSLGKVDLMSDQYQFHQQLIGSTPLEPGHYTQTRLVLSRQPGANQIVLKGAAEAIDLIIPSGSQTGLKLIGEFDVVAGQGQAIIIDFAPDKMIHMASDGKWIMRPTCPIVTATTAPSRYGGLIGKVMPSEAWGTAVVSAYQPSTGAVIASTTVSQPAAEGPADSDGSFRLILPSGDYGLKVTATGYQAYDSAAATPPTWTVVTGTDTDAGIITLTVPASQ